MFIYFRLVWQHEVFGYIKVYLSVLCIYRGGLIFTVLAHSLYLLTLSILEGLDKDTHVHGDVNRERSLFSIDLQAHKLRLVVTQSLYHTVVYEHS